MKKQERSSPPIPPDSPFVPVEVVDEDHLNKQERRYLEAREGIIEAGRGTFLDVGQALIEIRDYEKGKLYKKRHGTFEDYCRERWEFGRAHAYRLMDAAEIYTGMSPRGDKNGSSNLPTSKKQLRALKPLSSSLRKKAWAAARKMAEPDEPHASDVQRTVREVAKEEGIELRKKFQKPTGKKTHYRLDTNHLKAIRSQLTNIREAAAGTKGAGKIGNAIEKIEALLPEI